MKVKPSNNEIPKLKLNKEIIYKITKITSCIWITHNRSGDKSIRAKIDVMDNKLNLLYKHEIEIISHETGLLSNKERMRMGDKLKAEYVTFKKDIGAI